MCSTLTSNHVIIITMLAFFTHCFAPPCSLHSCKNRLVQCRTGLIHTHTSPRLLRLAFCNAYTLCTVQSAGPGGCSRRLGRLRLSNIHAIWINISGTCTNAYSSYMAVSKMLLLLPRKSGTAAQPPVWCTPPVPLGRPAGRGVLG